MLIKILIVICVIVVGVGMPIGIPMIIYYMQFKNLPKKEEQVKVVRKRKDSFPIEGLSDHYAYFVTFKFSDNSEKEFFISSGSEEAVPCPSNVYFSIRKNDKGTLVYKERENATKNEKRYYYHDERKFISFETD